MRFGSTVRVTTYPNGMVEKTVTKVRDYSEIVNETVHEERVRIIRVSDFDEIMAKLHIEHPLEDHGGYIEHAAGGKMYAVKMWVTKHPIA